MPLQRYHAWKVCTHTSHFVEVKFNKVMKQSIEGFISYFLVGMCRSRPDFTLHPSMYPWAQPHTPQVFSFQFLIVPGNLHVHLAPICYVILSV